MLVQIVNTINFTNWTQQQQIKLNLSLKGVISVGEDIHVTYNICATIGKYSNIHNRTGFHKSQHLILYNLWPIDIR
jgi:hypothetical protein